MVKDPQKYLVDADIVITSSYMSMLEAAAMGKPVIAIGNSELKEDYLNCHPLRKWMRFVRILKNWLEGSHPCNYGRMRSELHRIGR